MSDKGYTTEEKINEFLNTTIAAGAADDYILAAQEWIDKYSGRNFKADAAASERFYNGNSKQDLCIDDCVQVTKVERGLDAYKDSEEEISAGGQSGYFLFPNNHVTLSPTVNDGHPIQTIRLRDRVWLGGFGNHTITAKWGFSVAVPDDISFAATVIAAGMYNFNRGGGGSGDIKSEKIGNYSVSYDVGTSSGSDKWGEFSRAKTIVNNYKKWSL